MTTLDEVTTTADPGFPDFAALPHLVHADDPVWAPESDEAVAWAFAESAVGRTPLWAVVARDGGAPVARAAAFAPVDGVGTVGLLACLPNHREAGVAVLRACEHHLASLGATTVRAPASDPLTVGLQTGGFELPQTVLTPHNPPWYLDLLETAGYGITMRMVAPLMTRRHAPRFLTARAPGVVVRSSDPDRMAEDLGRYLAVHRVLFSPLAGLPPRAPADSARLFERLLPVVDPALVVLAEVDGDVVGAILCLPDAWQHLPGGRVDRARIVTIGVRPGLQRRRIGLAMGTHLMGVLLRGGYRSVEGVWVREENTAPRALARRFGAQDGRRFALLEKSLLS
ncbi:MAG: GNAT family N-acetyltransferase [Actinomycetales bacterium]|nr:GNAT family N-acetyltransferase [Actinomycetales bacterium]